MLLVVVDMFNDESVGSFGASVEDGSFDLAGRLYVMLSERLGVMLGACDDLKKAIDSGDVKKLKKVISEMRDLHFNESYLQDLSRLVGLVYRDIK